MCARSRRGPVGGFALSEADDAWLPRWRNAVGRRGPTRRASSASPARSTSPTATAAARSSRRSRPSTKRRPRNICPRALLGRFFVHSDGARASFLFAQLPLSRSLRPRADVASLQAWAWWARVGDLTCARTSVSLPRSLRCVLPKELKSSANAHTDPQTAARQHFRNDADAALPQGLGCLPCRPRTGGCQLPAGIERWCDHACNSAKQRKIYQSGDKHRTNDDAQLRRGRRLEVVGAGRAAAPNERVRGSLPSTAVGDGGIGLI